jgi:hypothetical protein
MSEILMFVSYCHKDESYLNELEKWLSTLRNPPQLDYWYDKNITGGGNINQKINENLVKADIVLLLLSQNYLASPSCKKELDYALINQNSKVVVPIILSTCTWSETDCNEILALPKDGLPIDDWSSKDKAWKNVYDGLKIVIAEREKKYSIRQSYVDEILTIEFIKQGTSKISLMDIFIHPNIWHNKDAFTQEIIKLDDLNNLQKNNKVIIKGRDFCGKTSLIRWLFIKYKELGYNPLLIDGNTIHQTKDFKETIRKAFDFEYSGSFVDWFKTNNKIVLIDNYQHNISNGIVEYLSENTLFLAICITEEEYLVYYKDDPDYSEFSVLSIGQLPLAKQEDLVIKWMELGLTNGEKEKIDDLMVDKLLLKINNVITVNRIVPRYPFYILSILQSLEVFMPHDLAITAFGHCYQSLVVAQIIKKGIKPEHIDTCFNYFRELSFDMYKRKGDYIYSDYEEFKKEYISKFYITDSVIKRLENADYPIINIKDNKVKFTLDYIYYFFIGMALAKGTEQIMLNDIIDNIHIRKNALIIIFTVHHTENKELLDTILLHCLCSFDKIKPAELNTSETQFMNELVLELPNDIISNADVKENRKKLYDEIDKNSEIKKEDDSIEDYKAIDLNKGLRIIEVLGQILKNRGGSFPKDVVRNTLEYTIDLGLRILNLFIISVKSDDFKKLLRKMLDEKENEGNSNRRYQMDSGKKFEFLEKTIKLFGYISTVGMLNLITSSINSEKLSEPMIILQEEKNTPAYDIISFIFKLNQGGIDVREVKSLIAEYDKSKNYWAKKTLSHYIQGYMNTHRLVFSDRQKVYKLLGLEKYVPNR